MTKYLSYLPTAILLAIISCGPYPPFCEKIKSVTFSHGIHTYIENYNKTITSDQTGILYLFTDTISEKGTEDSTYLRQNYAETVFNPFSLSNHIGAKLAIGLTLSSTLGTDTCFLDTLSCEDTAYIITVYIDSFPNQIPNKQFKMNYNNSVLRIYYDRYLTD
jgi:hypothetical protein